MAPTPYLFFNGQCREALDTYIAIFGGEIESMMPASDMPPGEMEVTEDRRDWVMHASIKVAGGSIMASDNLSGTSGAMTGCSVMVSLPSAVEGRAAFDKLAEGGEVQMAYEPSFWSAGFGMVTDRFGIRWMIGTDEAPG